MTLSKEWWEYHLTPNGWVVGDERLDFGGIEKRPVPADRVLTIRETEIISSSHSKLETTWSEVYRSDDEELVQNLLEKYGNRGSKLK